MADQSNAKKAQRALFEAAKKGDVEGIKKAMEAGADVNAQSERTGDLARGALHMAVASGNAKAVEALLAVPGIDVNATDYDGLTPLILATYQGKSGVVKRLIADPKVDLNARNEIAEGGRVMGTDDKGNMVELSGMTALDWARRRAARKDPAEFKPIAEMLEAATEERGGAGVRASTQDDRANPKPDQQGATTKKQAPHEAALAAMNGLRLPHSAADYENKPAPSVPSGPNAGRGIA